MGSVYSPPEIVDVQGPIIFLAGPIQGSEDWQKEAIEIIQDLNPEVNIANPRRHYLPGDFIYSKQVDWETHFLNLASKQGVIVFWLAKESDHDPERAYAQTSRVEIGEWMAKCSTSNGNIKLIIGIEEGFSGAKYLRRRVPQECPNAKIFDNLKDVCMEASKNI